MLTGGGRGEQPEEATRGFAPGMILPENGFLRGESLMMRSVCLCVVLGSSAAVAQVFDITGVAPENSSGIRELSGTSNGVAWTISPTDYYRPFSVLDGTYQGFTGPNFRPSLPMSDVAHIGALDFRLTFEEPIEDLVVFVSENSSDLAWLDMGIEATPVSGDVRTAGTAFGPSTWLGGAVRLRVDGDALESVGLNPWNSLNVAFAPTCRADYDASLSIDVQDLLAFLGAFRSGTGDFDANGSVDVQDLLAFLGAFRKGC